MSKLDGHHALTRQAVKEVGDTCSTHLIANNLRMANLPHNVVMRDLLDIPSGGHWADFGQKHHFMRQFDGQSPLQAYFKNIDWIHTNSIKAAKVMSLRIRRYMGTLPSAGLAPHAVKTNKSCTLEPFISDKTKYADKFATKHILHGYYGHHVRASDIPDWQSFGNALHALQDSFAKGHAIRSSAKSEHQPGAIEHIKIYAGTEVEGHSDFDKLWKNAKTKQFSQDGRLAINASKELILCIIRSAQTGVHHGKVTTLYGWDEFKSKWLIHSKNLSNQRDFAIDLIAKYHTGTHIGNHNIKTLNFDEEGLANALVRECGTNTQKILSVFVRLQDHYSSDVDDVALEYINRIQLDKLRHIGNAVKADKRLSILLIQSMKGGWTGSDEKRATKFLKN